MRRASSARARTRRPARPRIALAPMLQRRGTDEELAGLDREFLLSSLPDGWRCLAVLDDRVRLRSRSGHDLAADVPAVAQALQALRPGSRQGPTILDGILVLPPASEDSAPALADVEAFVVLDVLCLAGRDVTAEALQDRLDLLRAVSWRDDAVVRLATTWVGDASASRAQLDTAGRRAHGALLARRATSRYVPGCRSGDWISFGEPALAEMLLCGISSNGALALGMPMPQGLVFAGMTWPTRRWRDLARRCREGPEPFAALRLWPSLGAVAWAAPEIWLAVEPDVRTGSGRGGPRWRLVRVQEDLTPRSATVPDEGDASGATDPFPW